MPAPSPCEPVKLLAALLWSDPAALDLALRRAEAAWGPIDHAGADHPFDSSSYYEHEMGRGLRKRIVSFRDLVAPERLVELKLAAISLEDSLRGPEGRRVNIDPGTLDVHKLILASVKPAAQKIPLGRGVHADMVLRYSRGAFHPFEWTFADFRKGLYSADLLAIRAIYKTQLSLQNCR